MFNKIQLCFNSDDKYRCFHAFVVQDTEALSLSHYTEKLVRWKLIYINSKTKVVNIFILLSCSPRNIEREYSLDSHAHFLWRHVEKLFEKSFELSFSFRQQKYKKKFVYKKYFWRLSVINKSLMCVPWRSQLFMKSSSVKIAGKEIRKGKKYFGLEKLCRWTVNCCVNKIKVLST